MYYLNKIVGWFTSPFGLLIVGMLAATFFRKRKIIFHTILWLALGSFYFFTTGLGVRLIGAPLEVSPVEISELPTANAIVLLGGGMSCDPDTGRAEMCSAADRVWMAAKIWKAGKSKRFIATGPWCDISTGGLLADFGVSTNEVSFHTEARNTEEESRAVYAELIKVNIHPSIILVTSAWHMPRAKFLFESAGLTVYPAPTDYEFGSLSSEPFKLTDILPNAEALFRNSYALKEWVARLAYLIVKR